MNARITGLGFFAVAACTSACVAVIVQDAAQIHDFRLVGNALHDELHEHNLAFRRGQVQMRHCRVESARSVKARRKATHIFCDNAGSDTSDDLIAEMLEDAPEGTFIVG